MAIRLELENGGYFPHKDHIGNPCRFWMFNFGCQLKGYPELAERRACLGFIDEYCVETMWGIDDKFGGPDHNLPEQKL